MAVAIPIIVIIVVGIATVIVLAANRQRGHGPALARDASAVTRAARRAERRSFGLDRARDHRTRAADDTRGDLRERARQAQAAATSTRWEPVDEEELGVSRRQFLNRGLVAIVGFSVAGFGAACLAFLWPTGSSGSAARSPRARLTDISPTSSRTPRPSTFPRPAPTSCSTRPRTSPRPRRCTARSPTRVWSRASSRSTSGVSTSAVASRGARRRSGSSARATARSTTGSARRRPAPPPAASTASQIIVGGGSMTINTGDIELGPPIGTNTTGQQQEGPLCV